MASRTAGLAAQFPDFPAADLPEIPAGFVDTSWHNDACPSFTNEAVGLILYVDYADASKRENEGALRYLLMSVGDFDVVIETDDLDAMLGAIKNYTEVKGGR